MAQLGNQKWCQQGQKIEDVYKTQKQKEPQREKTHTYKKRNKKRREEKEERKERREEKRIVIRREKRKKTNKQKKENNRLKKTETRKDKRREETNKQSEKYKGKCNMFFKSLLLAFRFVFRFCCGMVKSKTYTNETLCKYSNIMLSKIDIQYIEQIIMK